MRGVFSVEMATCSVCGKIFGTSAGSVCPSCRKLLDIVYEKARTYLRDNPKAEVRAKSLAEAIGEDARLVEILVMEGRFDAKDSPRMEESELEKRRKRLLQDLQKNLELPVRQEEKTTYGSSKHGKRVDGD
jgi:phage FluMu protein Com